MPTKSQLTQAEQLRNSRPPRPKQEKPPRRDIPVDTSLPGVSASDRHVGNGHTAPRNLRAHAVGAALEDSATGKPSRKSTRKSAGHEKLATALTRQQIRKVSSSKVRAMRAQAR
ncbi:MAG: hypothetical protein QM756_23120 [Polyangiaceae bacterium]